MIDRYLLRYFLAVVDQGNFSRAAAHCRVSQPTLSVGIAKLEALLGRPLFLRSNRRVELTPAGIRFAARARRIEAEFIEAERDREQDTPTKLIRLGISPSLPTSLIEQALVAVNASAPRECLEVVEGRRSELLPMLDRGRIDAVLGVIDGDPRGRELFGEPYGVALSRSHPMAERRSIAVEDIAGDTMIVRRHCEALSETSRFFTARGVRPFMAARTFSDDRALGYVRAGLGITVMPRCFAGEGIAWVPLAGFDLTRRVGWLIAPEATARVESSEAMRLMGERLAACGSDQVIGGDYWLASSR